MKDGRRTKEKAVLAAVDVEVDVVDVVFSWARFACRER